jgi:branched-chain amino acid transport system substrate-binding protein
MRKTLAIVLFLVLAIATVGASAETFKIGMVAPITGTSSLVGEYMTNGFNLAADEINAAGGILGCEVVLELADEVDTAQKSVNAMQLLLSEDDVMAIIGSYYSSNAIAALPDVLDAAVPTMVCGSSSGVSKEGNPYAWQARPLDTAQGAAMANFIVNDLKAVKPAIVYSTNQALQSLQEQLVAALATYGIVVDDSSLFGHPEDESNFAPYFAQIVAGDYDCIVSLETTALAAIVCQAAETAGVDTSKIPCVGATAFSNTITIQNAGTAGEGWYSIADWVAGGASETAQKFEDAYVAKYGTASDLGAAVVYDSIYLLKAACEAAGTATDKEAINEAMKTISGLEGAMSTFTYNEDHSFATSLMITQNIDGAAQVITAVNYR